VPLTSEHVDRLRAAPTATLREQIAAEIAGDYSGDRLTPRARADAVAIFRALLDDVEVTVRKAMAEALARARELPRDIALALARDAVEVALPVLELSEVLTEDDLVEIVRNPVPEALRRRFGVRERSALAAEAERRLVAVARRRSVSATLCAALIEEGTPPVAVTLLGNQGAEVDEPVAHRTIERFGTLVEVQTALVERTALPVTVVERLLFLTSEALRARLGERHNLSPRLLSGLALQVRERATLDLLEGDEGGARMVRLVNRLAREGRLTPTLILRALCTGKVAFFETALARRTGVSVEALCNRLRHGDRLDLKQLYRWAAVPAAIVPAFDSAVETAYRAGAGTDAAASAGSAAFARRMVVALAPLADGEGSEASVAFAEPDLDYLLARLCRGLAPPVDIAP
jgi:uncharacterized protein (DUF2336 family)